MSRRDASSTQSDRTKAQRRGAHRPARQAGRAAIPGPSSASRAVQGPWGSRPCGTRAPEGSNCPSGSTENRRAPATAASCHCNSSPDCGPRSQTASASSQTSTPATCRKRPAAAASRRSRRMAQPCVFMVPLSTVLEPISLGPMSPSLLWAYRIRWDCIAFTSPLPTASTATRPASPGTRAAAGL